jgi:hypothetical protein
VQHRATTCFDMSAKPAARWSPYRACPRPAPRCLYLFYFSLTRLYSSSPLSIRWLSPPEPVVDHVQVIEKSVFGILLPTRMLWAQLLCGALPASDPALDPASSCTATDSAASILSNSTSTHTGDTQDTISAAEAQAFISSVLQPCINLMHIDTARELMTQALACVGAWLMVIFYLSHFIHFFHTSLITATFRANSLPHRFTASSLSLPCISPTRTGSSSHPPSSFPLWPVSARLTGSWKSRRTGYSPKVSVWCASKTAASRRVHLYIFILEKCREFCLTSRPTHAL